MKLKKKYYKNVLELLSPRLTPTGTYCCWVNECGGYFAYCHKDGRLITKTGRGPAHPNRTWSSVGDEVFKRIICKDLIL